MNGDSWISVWVQAAGAIGTLAVAAAAIWGGLIRAYLAPSKLTIEPHDLRGHVTKFSDGTFVIFYNLKVVNRRSWIPARNCRVILKQVRKRAPNGEFQPIPSYSVPMPFVWAPAELTPPMITVVRDQVVDFGCLPKNAEHFRPCLYIYPNDFQGFVGPDEAARYFLEVVSDDFVSRKHLVVEVAWDGEWTDKLDDMKRHLVVRVVDA